MTSHIRGEGNSLAASVQEVVEIGRRAGVGVNVSHFKVTGLQNFGAGLERAIAVLEQARAQGQDVTADAYPYPAGSTTILSLVPPTVLEAAGGDTLGFLTTERGCRLLEQEVQKDFPHWDNMVYSIGWDRIRISSVIEERDRPLSGLSFAQAARQEGLSEAELFCRLLADNGSRVGVILMSMDPADVDRAHPALCVRNFGLSLWRRRHAPSPAVRFFPQIPAGICPRKRTALFGGGGGENDRTACPALRAGGPGGAGSWEKSGCAAV